MFDTFWVLNPKSFIEYCGLSVLKLGSAFICSQEERAEGA